MTVTAASENSHYLRPEARAFNWMSLHSTQQVALRKIYEALSEAIRGMDSQSSSYNPHEFIDNKRLNQTILLGGDRGTGKTSLMFSLQQSLNPNSDWLTESLKNPAFNEEWHQFKQTLSNRVVWLETLDMETLPGPTNLLVAILARIDSAVRNAMRDSSPTMGWSNPAVGSEDVLMELRRLTTDASLAWDGNTRERASSLDADAYATEVMRAEQSRLALNPRFRKILNDLATTLPWSHIKSPLFLLPVDDFDLNPVRCLDLLRLIRTINVPRLFTLILGDIRVAEEVFRLKMAGDFARVADVRLNAFSLYQTDFFARVKGLTPQAMRKLLPPAQRIELQLMAVEESLGYRPDDHGDELRTLLSQWKLDVELPLVDPPVEHGETAIATLADFLLVGPMSSGLNKKMSPGGEPSTGARNIYRACQLLNGSTREIIDLWFSLSRPDTAASSKQTTANLIENVRRWVCEALEKDSKLTFDQLRRLQDDLADAGKEGTFKTDLLRLRVTAPAWSVKEVIVGEGNTRRQFEFRYVRDINLGVRELEKPVEVTDDDSDDDQVSASTSPARQPSVFLIDTRTQGYITLLHDLVALSEGSPIEGNWLLDDLSTYRLATVSWTLKEQTIHFPWWGMKVRSLWELDRLTQGWNRFLNRPPNRAAPESQLEEYAAFWVSANAAMLLGEECLDAAGHSEVVKQVERLVDQEANGTKRFGIWRRYHTLLHLTCTLCFESGIPIAWSAPFWESEILNAFWSKESNQKEIRQLRDHNLGMLNRPDSFLAYWLASPRKLLQQLQTILAPRDATSVRSFASSQNQRSAMDRLEILQELANSLELAKQRLYPESLLPPTATKVPARAKAKAKAADKKGTKAKTKKGTKASKISTRSSPNPSLMSIEQIKEDLKTKVEIARPSLLGSAQRSLALELVHALSQNFELVMAAASHPGNSLFDGMLTPDVNIAVED